MKLITDQVTIMQQEIHKLAEEIKLLNETKERDKATQYTRPGDSDYEAILKIQENADRIQELSDLLEESTIIPNPNSERVELGSHFKVFLKYGKEDMEFLDVILIEKLRDEKSPEFLSINQVSNENALYYPHGSFMPAGDVVSCEDAGQEGRRLPVA